MIGDGWPYREHGVAGHRKRSKPGELRVLELKDDVLKLASICFTEELVIS